MLNIVVMILPSPTSSQTLPTSAPRCTKVQPEQGGQWLFIYRGLSCAGAAVAQLPSPKGKIPGSQPPLMSCPQWGQLEHFGLLPKHSEHSFKVMVSFPDFLTFHISWNHTESLRILTSSWIMFSCSGISWHGNVTSRVSWDTDVLVWVFITVKRHHDQDNSNKENI